MNGLQQHALDIIAADKLLQDALLLHPMLPFSSTSSEIP